MKLLIDVKSNKPLSSYGDNHIIAYDPNSQNYYVTTADSFFAGQNEKIKKMLENYIEINEKVDKLQNELSDFESNIDTKFENFLKTYQETNAKLIAMVKELIEAKEE